MYQLSIILSMFCNVACYFFKFKKKLSMLWLFLLKVISFNQHLGKKKHNQKTKNFKKLQHSILKTSKLCIQQTYNIIALTKGLQ